MNTVRMATVLTLALLVPSTPGFAGVEECYEAFLDRDLPRLESECQPLAEQGDAWAQKILGATYLKWRNYAEALRWYRMAADQGDSVAQYSLAQMYDFGRGVPADYAEAARWYQMAAERGHIYAQFNLGVMCSEGTGVPADYVLAHMWFNIVAAQTIPGDSRHYFATEKRDYMADRMTPEQIAEAQRLAREWKPTE